MLRQITQATMLSVAGLLFSSGTAVGTREAIKLTAFHHNEAITFFFLPSPVQNLFMAA